MNIVRSVNRTNKATTGNKTTTTYLTASLMSTAQTTDTLHSQQNTDTETWLLYTVQISSTNGEMWIFQTQVLLNLLGRWGLSKVSTYASTINYPGITLYDLDWGTEETSTNISTGAVGTWTELWSADTPHSFPESLPAVKVTVGAQGWPLTQILKQGPTVALASVSSNLPALQRRQTNWLASGA